MSGLKLWAFVALLVGVSAVGCDRSSSSPGGGPAPGGTAAGRITRLDGRPIGIDGVKYDLGVYGMSAAGEKFTYTPKPTADGTWSTKLTAGIYHAPTATMDVPFNGQTFRYHLVPTADLGDTDSVKGLTADFVWHVTGPQDTHGAPPDPANATHWYGGTCPLIWSRAFTNAAGKSIYPDTPPVGATFTFTATALGKAIDGADPKPITWHQTFDPVLSCLGSGALNDLPPTMGGWRITGQERVPDGTVRPLELGLSTAQFPAAVMAATIDVQIEPDRLPDVVPCSGPTLIV